MEIVHNFTSDLSTEFSEYITYIPASSDFSMNNFHTLFTDSKLFEYNRNDIGIWVVVTQKRRFLRCL